jgi:hypothetical protein
LAGICSNASFLRDYTVTGGTPFLRIFLWPRNPVSRKRRPREAETRFECRLRRRKSERLVLPRPLGGHVGEAGHSHAMRQPPRDESVGKRNSNSSSTLQSTAPCALYWPRLNQIYEAYCVRCGKAASCVDGPQLARVIFAKSTGRLQSCVRPFGAVAHDRWP